MANELNDAFARIEAKLEAIEQRLKRLAEQLSSPGPEATAMAQQAIIDQMRREAPERF